MDFFEQLDTLYTSGRYTEIAPFITSALNEARSEGDTQMVIAALNELGSYYRGISRYDLAGMYFDEAISEMDELGLNNSYGYAIALINSAGNYRMSGHPETAERLFLMAKDLLDAICGEKDYAYLSLLNNLSLVYQEQGKTDVALAHAKKALELVSLGGGEDHERATSLNNIASILISAGRFEEALQYEQDAIGIYDAMPEENVHHAAAINGMALIQYHLGNYESAVENLKRSAELNKHFFGENEDYIRVLENIAAVYERTGKTADAEEYRRKAERASDELERLAYRFRG